MNPLDYRWQMVRDRWPIRIKNGSGAVIPPFSVVLISSYTTSNNELIATVIQPNASSTDFNWNQYLVTGPFAIGAGSSNEGLATDLTQPHFVRYDGSGTPAAKDIWGPKHGQLTLTNGYYGFEILGGNTTASGNNVTVAKWIGIGEVYVKNASGGDYAAAGGPYTFQVWGGPTGSEANTGMTLSAYNKTSQAFKDTKFGAAARMGTTVYAAPHQT